MQHARIISGVVAEIMVVPTGFQLADCYTPNLVAQCVDAPDTVKPGWTYDGTTFAAPASIKAPPVDLKDYAASARFTKETAGITVSGASIATDRDSQAMITGAWSAAQIDPNLSVQWKTSSGFVALNAAQIQSIASAVAAHVQACFAAEQQVDAGITAGTITTTAQVDAAFAAVTV